MPDFSNWKRDVLIELVAALILIGLIAIAGCRNDAITYMHAIDPNAACKAMRTTTGIDRGGTDTAVCVSGGRAYTCSAGSIPECKDNGAVIVERK